MSKNRQWFSLAAAKALDGSRLQLVYADGVQLTVDLAEWIGSTRALRPLRDARLFASARVGSFGRTVEFGKGEIDLGADNLRNLAVEQAGGIGHERIWNWMERNHLTVDQGAEVLDISRRMLIYYRSGEKAIPRHIWLACIGWETLNKHGVAA